MILEGIAAKWADMPEGVDANGASDLDRARDADRFVRFAEAQTPAIEAPHAMIPNPAQGSGATVPAPAPTDPLEAIKVQARKLLL